MPPCPICGSPMPCPDHAEVIPIECLPGPLVEAVAQLIEGLPPQSNPLQVGGGRLGREIKTRSSILNAPRDKISIQFAERAICADCGERVSVDEWLDYTYCAQCKSALCAGNVRSE